MNNEASSSLSKPLIDKADEEIANLLSDAAYKSGCWRSDCEYMGADGYCTLPAGNYCKKIRKN